MTLEKESKETMANIAIEFLKSMLKPGYLYGIGPDGELYCVEDKIPKTGYAVTIRAAMPKLDINENRPD